MTPIRGHHAEDLEKAKRFLASALFSSQRAQYSLACQDPSIEQEISGLYSTDVHIRPLLQHFCLVVIGIVAALFIFELGGWIYLGPPQNLTDNQLATVETHPLPKKVIQQDSIAQYQRVFNEDGRIYHGTPNGFRLRPNSVAQVQQHVTCKCPARIETNSLGYRNREIKEKKFPRALFLGDSITMAEYIPEHLTWVRLVESLSKEVGRPIETINAGVGTLGLSDYLAVLLETGLATEPDMVVVGWYLNDAQSSSGVFYSDIPSWARWSHLGLTLYPIWKHYNPPQFTKHSSEENNAKWRAWKQESAHMFPPGPGHGHRSLPAFYRHAQSLFFDWGSSWSAGVWKEMEPIFYELKRQSVLHDFKLMFVLFPVADQVFADFVEDYPQQQVKRITDKLGVSTLDLLPLFRKDWRSTQESLFYDWCHHSVKGNKKIASWVSEFLQEETKELRSS